MPETYAHIMSGPVPRIAIPPIIVLAAWCLRAGTYPPSDHEVTHCGWCDAQGRPVAQADATGIGWTLRVST